jgi:hypothetical protein
MQAKITGKKSCRINQVNVKHLVRHPMRGLAHHQEVIPTTTGDTIPVAYPLLVRTLAVLPYRLFVCDSLEHILYVK